ncbi:MAG: homoserine kinase, partial [Oligoflexus sp.]
FGLTDLFAEPARGQLIPHFFQAQKQALSAGGYGFSISGSGPTCFALSPSKQKAEAIQRAVAEVFGPATSVLVTRVRHQGAEVFDV